MTLPLIPKMTFEVKNRFLPKGKIQMVPFGVGQEQYLIQMKDAETNNEKIDMMRQIIEQCIKTPDINVSTLPLFVIEELFLRLKQNSSGEIVELGYECTNPLGNDEVCKNKIKLDLDVRDIKLKEEEGHTNKVIISDPIGIQFRYPDIEMSEKAGVDLTDDKDMIISCIDMIFDDESVYPAEEHTREELIAFWDQISLPQKKEVYEKFFLSMPHLHYKNTIKCSKCGTDHTIEFNNLSEVFT